MVIRFKRKSQWEWLVLFILAMPFAFAFLMEFLRFPAAVKYMLDAAWLLLVIGLLRKRKNLPNTQSRALAVITVVFFGMTLIGFLLHLQSPLYYLWGMRNNVRFFVFFFSCISFLREDSLENYLHFLDRIFWINIPVVLFQYFILGKNGDYLGGVFGVQKGCNAYMNIFLMLVMTRTLLLFMNRRENLKRCLTKCAVAFIVAALSELKMFFLEAIVIVFLAAAMTRFSLRKLWIILGVSLGMAVAIRMIYILFPVFENWFRLESIWESAITKRGYTSSNDMNRLTAVSIALARFLPSLPDKLFGLGLGNCDYASFSFLVTPFYRAYGYLNYAWFSSSFLVLETGLLGLSIYIAFFAVLYFGANKREKFRQSDVVYCQTAKIMAVMCLVLIVYNNSLRMESAYMLFFVLALPFVKHRAASRNA